MDAAKRRRGLPTLVFVHGLTGGPATWDGLKRELSRYPQATFVLAGHDIGKWTFDGFSHEHALRKFASDLRTVPRPRVIIGESYADLLLESHYDDIDAAILLAPTTVLRHRWLGPPLVRILARVLPHYIRFKGRNRNPIPGASAKGLPAWVAREFVDAQARRRHPRPSCPVLCIFASGDHLVNTPASVALCQRLGMETTVLDHDLHVILPGMETIVTREVEAFLERHGLAAPARRRERTTGAHK